MATQNFTTDFTSNASELIREMEAAEAFLVDLATDYQTLDPEISDYAYDYAAQCYAFRLELQAKVAEHRNLNVTKWIRRNFWDLAWYQELGRKAANFRKYIDERKAAALKAQQKAHKAPRKAQRAERRGYWL